MYLGLEQILNADESKSFTDGYKESVKKINNIDIDIKIQTNPKKQQGVGRLRASQPQLL